MNSFDENRFDTSVQQLFETIIDCSDEDMAEISFLSGYIHDQEGYKREIAEASKLLNVSNWSDAMIGSGEICAIVLKMFRYRTSSDGRQQNLVDWRDIDSIVEPAFSNKVKESEAALFQLFVENDYEIAFDMLVSVFGRRFPIISFLFFLNDSTQFMPVRPDVFNKRFQRVGIETDCLKGCTWANYQEFCDILFQVRNRIQKYFKEDVELIDAHSFVWMMWNIEDKEPNDRNLVSSEEDVLENSVIEKRPEGLMKKYYTPKYERNAKNRRDAVRIHGLKCMACGFDFEEKYGEIGKGFIEVHHIKPLYSLDEVVEIDPMTDMVCLCANCHKMVHRKKNHVLSIDELKACIERTKAEGARL